MSQPESAGVTAEVPSNIAFVKYWGKRDADAQWPANDSLSMTLSVARTITTATAHDGPRDEIYRDGQLQGQGPGGDKASRHLEVLRRDLGVHRRLLITTRNTFPSDCGIASSASGLGALTLAAIGAWTGASSLHELEGQGFPRARLAQLARLGSGSACRSLYGGFVLWQAGPSPDEQTVRQLHDEEAWPLADIIVVVDRTPKPVSSTTAHRAAWTSPLYSPRLAGLPARLARVQDALDRSDLEELGRELEAEALEMHGVMMSSTPSAVYLTEATSQVLAWLRRERTRQGLPAYFTLDAGPNVHVICERQNADWVGSRISAEFPDAEVIMDRAGAGPVLMRTPREPQRLGAPGGGSTGRGSS
jgi:diphosphomevalonate decarboxylase